MDPALNEVNKAISKGITEGTLKGFWWALKLMWPFILLAIAFRIFEGWVNRKIDDWKRRRRNKGIRSFSNSNKNKSKVCPKCGGELKERMGKYGKFLGCSNYPKCQYTENIKK